MELFNMMDAARLEAGYPETNTDWYKYIEEYKDAPDKLIYSTDHGFIAGTHTTDYLLMDGIRICLEVAWYVKPEFRNQGAGSDLYDYLCDWATLKGCKYILQGRPTKGCTKVGNFYLRKL